MTLRNAVPIRFSPAGLSDSLDETDLFPGACSVLQNLIPDPTTKNIWTCRPAASQVTHFAGFNTPGVISVQTVIGSLVYGLVASTRNVGYDEPFCYNILTSAFVTVAGITAANVPLTPASVGDWVPPTMANSNCWPARRIRSGCTGAPGRPTPLNDGESAHIGPPTHS